MKTMRETAGKRVRPIIKYLTSCCMALRTTASRAFRRFASTSWLSQAGATSSSFADRSVNELHRNGTLDRVATVSVDDCLDTLQKSLDEPDVSRVIVKGQDGNVVGIADQKNIDSATMADGRIKTTRRGLLKREQSNVGVYTPRPFV